MWELIIPRLAEFKIKIKRKLKRIFLMLRFGGGDALWFFSKKLKMFFSSVSDVLCAISDAANMNDCLVLLTLSNTATRLPQGEKRPCLLSYGSCPLCFQYRWPIPQSVTSFSTFVLILFIFFFKEEKRKRPFLLVHIYATTVKWTRLKDCYVSKLE